MKDALPIKTEKPWGFEVLFAHTPEYAGKLIFVNKGHRLSLQYHRKKDETIYIYKGKAKVELEKAAGRHLASSYFTAGQCYRVLPNMIHRLEALEDTIIFEVSTPELEDVVRINDDYGRSQN